MSYLDIFEYYLPPRPLLISIIIIFLFMKILWLLAHYLRLIITNLSSQSYTNQGYM